MHIASVDVIQFVCLDKPEANTFFYDACGTSTIKLELSTMIQAPMHKSEISFYYLCSLSTSTYSDWSFYDRLGRLISDKRTVENPFPLIVLPLVLKAVPCVTGAFRYWDRS